VLAQRFRFRDHDDVIFRVVRLHRLVSRAARLVGLEPVVVVQGEVRTAAFFLRRKRRVLRQQVDEPRRPRSRPVLGRGLGQVAVRLEDPLRRIRALEPVLDSRELSVAPVELSPLRRVKASGESGDSGGASWSRFYENVSAKIYNYINCDLIYKIL
jgi:hypothetical protein